MRVFVAVELPESVLRGLEGLRERFRGCGARASWVKTENMHLTLRFLGEIGEAALAGLGTGLRTACAGRAGLTLALKGTGVFPNPRRPSVVWAGLEAASGDLMALQRAVEGAVRAAGLGPDDKAFHPHVTLGRIRDRRRLGSLAEVLDRTRGFSGGAFGVAHVSLFQSTLTPRGPVYECLDTYPLSC